MINKMSWQCVPCVSSIDKNVNTDKALEKINKLNEMLAPHLG